MILLPPWLACPKIERYSIGWRMGYGEDYLIKWGEWYQTLSDEETVYYQGLFLNHRHGKATGIILTNAFVIHMTNFA